MNRGCRGVLAVATPPLMRSSLARSPSGLSSAQFIGGGGIWPTQNSAVARGGRWHVPSVQ